MAIAGSATLALALSLGCFVLFGFTQFTDYLLQRLETAVPAGQVPPSPAAIIVLGGGIIPQWTPGGTGFELAEAADRLVKGLELKRLHPGARLIFSGGSGTLIASQLPETAGALAMTQALYGDDRGMELESRSRTTFENAAEVRKMLGENPGPLLLVTSAFHMPRAIGCFRKLGMDVIPGAGRFPGRCAGLSLSHRRNSQPVPEAERPGEGDRRPRQLLRQRAHRRPAAAMIKGIDGTAALALALALGAAGAALAWLASVPAPFILGPAVIVTIAGVAGLETTIPVPLRNGAFAVIGAIMGSSVTPQVLEAARHWPQSFAMLALSIVAIMAVTTAIFRRFYVYDRVTAVLSSDARATSASSSGSARRRAAILPPSA